MTQPDPRPGEPAPDEEVPPTPAAGPRGAIEGADAGALGVSPPPETSPGGARVEDAQHRVPGAHFERPLRESKPWFTTLAAESDQAGVGNQETED